MKKGTIKKFFSGKGGVVAVITTAFLIVLALVGMLLGYVYGDLGGDWSRIGELFKADWFWSIVILIGVLIFMVIYLFVILDRKKERY